MTHIEDALNRRLIWFTGKGGVGKTTVTWATALALAKKGKRVLVASWNPFEQTQPPVAIAAFGIRWERLETFSAFREYVLKILKFDKIYDVIFQNHVFRTFIRTAPGMSDTVIAGKIMDLCDQQEVDHLLIDLPSSGHAVSFFESPFGVNRLFRVGFVHKESTKILSLFKDEKTRLDLVTLPEELPVTECLEFKEKLERLCPFPFGFVHLNQCVPSFSLDQVTEALPDAVEVVRDRHEKECHEEKEATERLKEINLPLNRILQIPAPSAKKVIEEIAQGWP